MNVNRPCGPRNIPRTQTLRAFAEELSGARIDDWRDHARGVAVVSTCLIGCVMWRTKLRLMRSAGAAHVSGDGQYRFQDFSERAADSVFVRAAVSA